MKRVLVIVMATLVALVPATAASAQPDGEIELLDETAAALAGADAAEWTAGLGDVETALADARAVAPDLDYAELDAAIVDLKTAIDGGDVAEMEAAGVVVADAIAGVVAQAGDGTAPAAAADEWADTGPSELGISLVAAFAILAAGVMIISTSRRRFLT